MTNIVDVLKGYVTSELASKAAEMLGEDSGGITKAASSLIPTILGGLLNKSSDQSAFGSIFDMLNNQQNDGWIDNLSGLIGGGNLAQNDPKDIAGNLMGSLFGNKVGGILDLISSAAGVKKSSGSSLLGMIGPLVMSYLGRKIRKEGLSAIGLGKLLSSQAPNIAKALPAGMGDLIGFSANAGKDAISKANGVTRSDSAASTGGNKWLWPLLIAAALIAGFLYLRGCESPNVPEVDVAGQLDKVKDVAKDAGDAVADVASGAVDVAKDAGSAMADAAEGAVDVAKDAENSVADAAGNAVEATAGAASSLAAFFKKKLACGVELNIPQNGIEAQVVEFIEDGEKVVDKTTWFNFDRLTFSTGSANLDMSKSEEQLSNIAEIMKCYPDTKVKLGGYTDNTGDADANMALSQNRANSVMAALIAKGVNQDRLVAEGYGDQHPVASNDTPEGRAKNRRIALRLTAK